MAQLPDEFVQSLLEEIARLGRIHARAKANAKASEELRKITKASLMKLIKETDGIRGRDALEAEAYTHPQYKFASDAVVRAIEEEITAQINYENAVREWESWRTLCANDRR